MAREKADYREMLSQLNRLFPTKEVLTTADCMQVLGCKSPKTVRTRIPIVKGKITKIALAKALC